MSGIIKVIASVFQNAKKLQSKVTVPGFWSTKINTQECLNVKNMTEFLGLKGHSLQFGIGGFPLKLFCLTIVTDRQWQLELPNLISDEGSSELNGKT